MASARKCAILGGAPDPPGALSKGASRTRRLRPASVVIVEARTPWTMVDSKVAVAFFSAQVAFFSGWGRLTAFPSTKFGPEPEPTMAPATEQPMTMTTKESVTKYVTARLWSPRLRAHGFSVAAPGSLGGAGGLGPPTPVGQPVPLGRAAPVGQPVPLGRATPVGQPVPFGRSGPAGGPVPVTISCVRGSLVDA